MRFKLVAGGGGGGGGGWLIFGGAYFRNFTIFIVSLEERIYDSYPVPI